MTNVVGHLEFATIEAITRQRLNNPASSTLAPYQRRLAMRIALTKNVAAVGRHRRPTKQHSGHRHRRAECARGRHLWPHKQHRSEPGGTLETTNSPPVSSNSEERPVQSGVCSSMLPSAVRLTKWDRSHARCNLIWANSAIVTLLVKLF